MRHEHADVIHAWAEGAEIQWFESSSGWLDVVGPRFYKGVQYRVKPEKKPDVTRIHAVNENKHILTSDGVENTTLGDSFHGVKIHGKFSLTFDGETGKLKSAEVLE